MFDIIWDQNNILKTSTISYEYLFQLNNYTFKLRKFLLNIYEIIVPVDSVQFHPDDRIILSILNGAEHLYGASNVCDDFGLCDERNRRSPVQTPWCREEHSERQNENVSEEHCMKITNFLIATI